MTLKPAGSNRSVIAFDDGLEVLFSYSTPVAAFVPGRGYIATARKYSVTTSRHVNQWAECTRIPDAEFTTLLRDKGVSI